MHKFRSRIRRFGVSDLLNNYKEEDKYNMISDNTKQKRDTLVKLGWEECIPEFDWQYFLEVSGKSLSRELGYFISEVADNSSNFFGLFGEKVDRARSNFISSMCPPVARPSSPPATACINATWPFNPSDYSNHTEAAFAELTYRTILRIVEKLSTPNLVYQTLGERENIVMQLDPSKFSIKDSLILHEVVLIWDDVYVTIEKTQTWNDNGTIAAYSWNLYSNKLREYSNSVLTNIGLEVNSSTYQLGSLDPEYKLHSFPEYIRQYSSNLELEMGLRDPNNGERTNKFPERFNTIIVGPPGYGSHLTIAHR